MTEEPTSRISSRKKPKQARSEDLVKAILEGAVRVLAEEGAHRFTTARVAERAGVSIGSLYQYFPNKASILFRLQSDEWTQTNELLSEILEDRTLAPMERLRKLVHMFIRSEVEEAAVRVALDDAAPLYRDEPEAKEAYEASDATIDHFMEELLPHVTEDARDIASYLVFTTMCAVGKEFSECPRTVVEVEAYAEAMAEMFCAYLRGLGAS